MTSAPNRWPFNDDPQQQIMRRVLEARPYLVQHGISSAVLETGSVDLVYDHLAEQFVVSLGVLVLSEPVRNATAVRTVVVPRTTWQMFKERYMPDWYISRYPVQYERHVLEVEATEWRTYPESEMPIVRVGMGHPRYHVEYTMGYDVHDQYGRTPQGGSSGA